MKQVKDKHHQTFEQTDHFSHVGKMVRIGSRAERSGIDPTDHFDKVVKMVGIGSWAGRERG